MSLATKLSALDKFADGYNKKKGKSVIGRLSKNEDLRKSLEIEFIPTPSLNVNAAMGGGFPKGKTSIVTGKSDSGKTFYLLETIAVNMKSDPDFIALWLESESSLSINDIEMFGIDLERFYTLEADPKGAEESLNALQSALATGFIDICVVNSLKCLTTSEEMLKGFDSLQVGAQSRMNSKMMRKLTPLVKEYGVAMVLIQHLTTMIGTQNRDPLELGGGLAIRYGASIILDYRKQSIGESDPINKEEGVKINVTVKKNHAVTNRFPYVKTHYYGIFGEGTERYLEALDLAVDAGVLTKAGAYISVPDETGDAVVLEDGTKLKWQGAAKFRAYCIENPDFFNEITSKLDGSFENLSEEEADELKEIEAKEGFSDDPMAKAKKAKNNKKVEA